MFLYELANLSVGSGAVSGVRSGDGPGVRKLSWFIIGSALLLKLLVTFSVPLKKYRAV